MKHTEADLQTAVARYLDLLGVLWFHPANERKTTPHAGARLKRMGVKPGVPDILIMESTADYHGIAIELKAGKNTLTRYQRIWLAALEERGWLAAVCYNLDEVMDVLKQAGITGRRRR